MEISPPDPYTYNYRNLFELSCTPVLASSSPFGSHRGVAARWRPTASCSRKPGSCSSAGSQLRGSSGAGQLRRSAASSTMRRGSASRSGSSGSSAGRSRWVGTRNLRQTLTRGTLRTTVCVWSYAPQLFPCLTSDTPCKTSQSDADAATEDAESIARCAEGRGTRQGNRGRGCGVHKGGARLWVSRLLIFVSQPARWPQPARLPSQRGPGGV